jgi:CheY-like chemotaxis protein
MLLDIQMPGIDGFEMARLIHEREKTRALPIIFLTAVYGTSCRSAASAGPRRRTRAAGLDTIDRQVPHLTRLVDDLLDVARITRGAIELRREPLALARREAPA